MRALCFLALKCGSGKQMKILESCARAKKLGRNFIVLVRRAETFWYPPGTGAVIVVDDTEGEGEAVEEEACACAGAGEEDILCACSLCERRTWMRPVTYSRTEMRISMPGKNAQRSQYCFLSYTDHSL